MAVENENKLNEVIQTLIGVFSMQNVLNVYTYK